MKTRLLFNYVDSTWACLSSGWLLTPKYHSIAVMHPNGIWEILISEKLLIKSLPESRSRLTEVSELSVQQIHSKPYLFFREKRWESPESGFTLMVALKEKAQNLWMAGNKFQICRGVYCSVCGFDEYWGLRLWAIRRRIWCGHSYILPSLNSFGHGVGSCITWKWIDTTLHFNKYLSARLLPDLQSRISNGNIWENSVKKSSGTKFSASSGQLRKFQAEESPSLEYVCSTTDQILSMQYILEGTQVFIQHSRTITPCLESLADIAVSY